MMVTGDFEGLPSKACLIGSDHDKEGLAEFDQDSDGIISFHVDLPAPLQLAMKHFIDKYPNWDQYRLIQAALAGFLVQNGVETRSITRLYVGNMFCTEKFTQGV